MYNDKFNVKGTKSENDFHNFGIPQNNCMTGLSIIIKIIIV